MLPRLAYILLLIGWCGPPSATAQLTTAEGLPSNNVYGTLQDRQGYIWVYTERGIARYDGYRFRPFTVADGLPTNDIFGLTEDPAGRLWFHCFATRTGYIQGDSVVTFHIDDRGVTEVIPTEDGAVVLRAGGTRLHRFRAGELRTENCAPLEPLVDSLGLEPYTYFRLLGDSVARTLVPLRDQTLEYDCARQLTRRIPATFDSVLVRHNRSVSQNFYRKIGNAHLWVNGGGVVRITETTDGFATRLVRWSDVLPPGGNRSTQFYYDGERLQFSTDRELVVMDRMLNVLEIVDPMPFVPGGTGLNRKMLDREGNLWIATENKGLILVTAQRRRVDTYAPPGNAKVTAVLAHRRRIHYGTEGGAIHVLEDGKPRLLLSEFANANPVHRLLELDANRLLVVRDQGSELLDLRSGSARSLLDLVEESSEPYPSGLTATKDAHLRTRDGSIWFAHFAGVTAFFLTKNGRYRPREVLRMRTLDLTISDRNELFTAHDDGVRRWQLDADGRATNPQKIDDRKSLCVEFHDGKLWIGTDGNGVLTMLGDSLRHVTKTGKRTVSEITFDATGRLLVATDVGLSVIDPRLDAPVDASVESYNRDNGLPSVGVHAVALTDPRYFWVGTDAGLSRVPRRRREQTPRGTINAVTGEPMPFVRPDDPLLLTELLVNGMSVSIDSVYDLSYAQNDLTFRFVHLNYRSEGRSRYRYRLAGLDEMPQTTTATEVRYSSLPPGEYRFELEAAGVEGGFHKMTSPKTLRLTIRPAWWMTWWFRAAAVLLFLGAVYVVYRYNIERIKRRTAERASVERRFAELELQALRSQMNPHFIFNCLNGIQSFILAGEEERATRYLGKFAKLMRRFLEASKNKFLPLTEEIELLTWYVELEQLRAKRDFTFKVVVDPELDAEAVEIPSLLLQPFVENAILHGLGGAPDHPDPRLRIEFRAEADDWVRCVVEDNGIGRTRAAELQRAAFRDHKSRATQIVNERLEVIREMSEAEVRLEIMDAEPQAEFVGTRIEVWVRAS